MPGEITQWGSVDKETPQVLLLNQKKVSGLDGIAIQQISAGTSHSLAWTALPRDR